MHVWMMRQCRAPRMKHQRCTDLRAQVPGIGSDGTQGLGGNIEQQAVDHRLVVPGDRTDRGGQREDHVVILHGQQVGLTCLEPPVCGARLALRAMAVTTRNGVRPITCLMGSCFEWGVDASSEREPCRPRSCNSPLKLVPKHGDDLVRRPERSPAQFRRNDCIEYLKLLSRVGASIDFGSSQIAMT